MEEVSKTWRVLLVGHCGPDASYLRMAVRTALGQVQIISAEDKDEMESAIKAGVDLVLFNRELGYGYEPGIGVEMIRLLRPSHAALPMMLVSNYADAQTAAEAAGAMPGFGKREIGTPRVTNLLRAAVGMKA